MTVIAHQPPDGEAGLPSSSSSPRAPSATGADLTSCDREPIHLPGSIQPHGVLLVLGEPELTVRKASANVATLFGFGADEALHRSVRELLGPDLDQRLRAELTNLPLASRPIFLGPVTSLARDPAATFHALVHRAPGGIVLELERAAAAPSLDVYPLMDAFTLRAEAALSMAELSQLTAEQVRRLTGFDRVLVYGFDAVWNGMVIGEASSGRLPSYLHHCFPAADIPAPARELYRLNRVRIIPDADYQPVPIIPPASADTGPPLDLSFSALRSVSPVHVDYMRNMGTAASMSVSLLRDGRLWGLIACHHQEPKTVSFQLRGLCDLIGRAFSLRCAALEHTQDYERRIDVQTAYAKLLAVMSDRGDFAAALGENPAALVSFTDAGGAAVLTEDGCLLLGDTPTETELRALTDWLFSEVKKDVYSTDSLSAKFPAAHSYRDKASGLLAIAVSKLHPSYVLWFRPEVIKTIKWGGNPRKPVDISGSAPVLHPRRSFETWEQIVRATSRPWQPSELTGAEELRNTIVGTVLRKAEELAALNAELTRSNKELEAFSYSVSHDLRAPLRHIAGYAEILKDSGKGKFSPKDDRCLAAILDSSEYAGRLVDKLLGFSRLGRSELQRARVDMNTLVRETQRDVMHDLENRKVTWKVAPLPTVSADLMMLRMAVRDLLSNAVKYTREREEAIIEIGTTEDKTEYVFFVKDNGVGFDMAYVDKLFGVFQRLHRWEDYEGTGIGLANVRRVMERHGGRTWAEGEEDKGATFYFTLPKVA